MKKELYFAPFEGITGYVYRNAFHKYFGGIDKFFIPFVVTNQNGKLKSKEHKDILPEHNLGMKAVPQILSNHAEQFIKMVEFLEQLGYEEINLNLGCPARTVVSKKKGSGFLAYPEELESFLEQVYNKISISLSIKTRIGLQQPEEFVRLLEIYNQFPIKELIIHPRLQSDYYNNFPNWEAFSQALSNSKNPVVYNGDIYTVEDANKVIETFPDMEALMLGRGLLRNPFLADQLTTNRKTDKEVLRAFHDEVFSHYKEILSGDRNLLFKMKELWFYLGNSFEDGEKLVKKILRVNRMGEYQELVGQLFEEKRLY